MMLKFIDKFLKFYYIAMLFFTIAAVITIFIRVNGEVDYFEDTSTDNQETNQSSESIELVGEEIFKNFNNTEFMGSLVKRHKQVIEEGLTISDINQSIKIQSLREIANTFKEKPVKTKKEEAISDYTQVSNWFYPVIYKLRKSFLYNSETLDPKNFNYEVFRLESNTNHVIREQYNDLVDESRNFSLDWKIKIEKDISGYDDDYKPVKYTQLTAALSIYKPGKQPDYSSATKPAPYDEASSYDIYANYYPAESSVTMEDLFFSSLIILTLIWGAIIFGFQLGFKNIIKNQHPEIYKNLGKARLTGNDNWAPFIINHEFRSLKNNTLDIYGKHLGFVYTHIRTYLMMMILVISMIKIIG
ncbi:MAG: hypothetical protein KAS07_05320 [Candidatus Pacebacteria bacterium]|nr:hypothetical protein [Candidatus Paceibacterota bacterium]